VAAVGGTAAGARADPTSSAGYSVGAGGHHDRDGDDHIAALYSTGADAAAEAASPWVANPGQPVDVGTTGVLMGLGSAAGVAWQQPHQQTSPLRKSAEQQGLEARLSFGLRSNVLPELA